MPYRDAEAARQIDETVRASGTDRALGTLATVRAQVSEGPAAEALYREAIERFGCTDVRITYARSRLLYGEWLRRENRRVDATQYSHLPSQEFVAAPAGGVASMAAPFGGLADAVAVLHLGWSAPTSPLER
jgi:hypothetical protein